MVKTLGEGLTTWDKLGFDIDPKAVQEEFGLSFLTGPSRERAPDPPAQPPAEPAKPNSGDGKARAIRLASGLPVAQASGFVDGQTYVDDLTDSGRALGGQALSELVATILKLVDEADDYESLRDAVLSAYRDAVAPEQLRAVQSHCLQLAELSGHAAVRQDAT